MKTLVPLPSRGRAFCGVLLAGVLGWVVSPAAAMRIVLTNDDGFESGNVQAVFSALKAAGHDVILSAPYADRSGASAQIGVLSGVPHTTAASPGGRIAAGSPGIGPTGIAPDQYYVDSSPVAAALFGIDVAARAKWGVVPDLLIGGPNIGNNLGAITPHSGTVGTVVTALNRGIPAIAFSAAGDDPATHSLLGGLVLRVVGRIERDRKILLPAGVGLNVNIPTLDRLRTAESYAIAYTRIGYDTRGGLRFVAAASDIPLALTERAESPGAPAVAWTPITTLAAVPADINVGNETAAFSDGKTVTISAIQGTYQASTENSTQVLAQLRDLFTSTLPLANPKLLNASARGFVGTGGSVQVVGFVVSSGAPKTFLIRASGPALTAFGVADALTDPQVQVFDQAQRLVAANDNWDDDATKAAALTSAAARAGAFALVPGSKDAAVLVTLAPGSYTAVVSAVGGATGIGLVEVFDLNVD